MTTVEIFLSLLFVLTLGVGLGLGLALLSKLRELRTQVTTPPAHVVAGLETVHRVQARIAEEMGRTAMGVEALMPTVQHLCHELRALHEKEEARSEVDREEREMLRRLEMIIAGGPRRGAAGENILNEVLSHLPPGLRDHEVRVDGKIVEFALRLPGNKFLPIDSKWPESSLVERLATESEPRVRAELCRRIDKAVMGRAAEVAKYLQPDRTMMLGVAAVPDPVYHASSRAHAEAYRLGVIIIPYSLAVPYVLSVLVLVWRFGQALDLTRLQGGLAAVGQALGNVLAIVESNLARAATMTENATARIRREVVDAQREIELLGIRENANSSIESTHPKPARSA